MIINISKVLTRNFNLLDNLNNVIDNNGFKKSTLFGCDVLNL